MVTRVVVPARSKAHQSSRARNVPGHLTERCLLSIIGILTAFMTLVHGMVAVSTLPPVALRQDIEVYWTVAALGVWVPSICLFASILGVVIRGKGTMAMLILSPVASIGGYLFYTYVKIEPLLAQLAAN